MRGREQTGGAEISTRGDLEPQGHPPDLYGPGGIPAMAQAEELRQASGQAPAPAHTGGGGGAYIPPSKSAALARHAANRRRMASIIEAGLQQAVDPALGIDSRKNLWRNSAEWVDNAQCELVVLTPTHDSALRAGAGEVAYFDARVDYRTEGATYSDNVADGGGVVVSKVDIGGNLNSDGTRLTVYDPCAHDEATNIGILIHEVQHDADQHQGRHAVGGPPSPGHKAPDWAYDSYRSELRAYWFTDPEGSASDLWPPSSAPVTSQLSLVVRKAGPNGRFGDGDDVTLGQATTRLRNGRQEAILRHLIGTPRPHGDWWVNGEWTQPYAYIAYYICLDPDFAQVVDEYDRPDSGNGLNSLRLQVLSDAIASRDSGRIAAACNLLDGADRMYLEDRIVSKPFWDQVERDLAHPALSKVRANLEAGLASSAIPTWTGDGGTYVVLDGDTLSLIAERALGDEQRAGEIVAVNPDTLTNERDIRAGMTLRMPLP